MKTLLAPLAVISVLLLGCNDSEPEARDSSCTTTSSCSASAPAALPIPSSPANDRDADGFSDLVDNCPNTANDQRDSDGDGLGDACDSQTVSACAVQGLHLVPLVQPHAVTHSMATSSCLGCAVTAPDNSVDHDPDSMSLLSLGVNLLGSLSLSVHDTEFRYPAGGHAGFVVAFPPGLIGLELLQSVSLTTYLDGNAQESADISGAALTLDLLQLLGSPERSFVSFEPTMAFDTLELSYGGILQLLPELAVYGACATPSRPDTQPGTSPTQTPTATPRPSTAPTAAPTSTPTSMPTPTPNTSPAPSGTPTPPPMDGNYVPPN